MHRPEERGPSVEWKALALLLRPQAKKSPEALRQPVHAEARGLARSRTSLVPGGMIVFQLDSAQLKNSLALSNQPLSVGLCLSPPFLSDSSSSLSSLRWCSVSLTGVSTRTWQYRSPG